MAIKDLIFGKKTLYYPGCLTKGILLQEHENYKWIFNKLGMDFVLLLNEEVCCGLPVLNGGYKKDARKLAEKNFELFKEKKIKKIVTSCPSCYHTFKHTYPELLRNWDIEVEHVTESVLKLLKKKKIDFSDIDNKEKVSYHDPCHLGRYSDIYDIPREVLSRLGGEVLEMKKNRKEALCCGGGGGLRANFPETAKKIARLRFTQTPKEAEKIISPCGLCFKNIQSATDKSEEFSSFVKRKLEEFK